LAEKVSNSQKVHMGRCGQGQVKGFGGDSELRMTRAEEEDM